MAIAAPPNAVLFFATGSDSRLTTYYGGEGRTMYDYYFTFRSMTQAQRAVGVLQQAAIYAVLERTPRAISPQGCGYAVKVLRGDVYRAANALRSALVFYEKCYQFSPGGRAKEVFP